MLGLWRTPSGRCLRGKHVTLKDRDFFKMPGEGLGGCKATHAGANHHGMSSGKILHEYLLKKGLSKRI
jgi:hypothetical protein